MLPRIEPGERLQMGEAIGGVPAPRGSFYCQVPEFVFATINASTGFGPELADDVPGDLQGMAFNEITLWVGEWYMEDPDLWVDPDAVRLRIYDDVCPPPLEPAQLIDVAWEDIETSLYSEGGPFVIREATIPLPADVVVSDFMSIGIQVVNPWGDQWPYVGVMALFTEDGFGCPLWVSDPGHGLPRWTSSEDALGDAYDIAYCLGTQTISVPPDNPPVDTVSWGRVKGLWR
jgi:hypothetical protein